jgi:hypothetical protein
MTEETMAGLERMSRSVQASVGAVGERLGRKAVQLAAEKAPARVQGRIGRMVAWCERHPVTVVAAIVLAKGFAGLLTGIVERSARR